jgi:hypothetical protein
MANGNGGSGFFTDTKAIFVGLIINLVLLAVSWGTLTEKVQTHDRAIKELKSDVSDRQDSSQDLRERMIRVETLLETIMIEVKGINLDLKNLRSIRRSGEDNEGREEFTESPSPNLDSSRNTREGPR